MLTDVTNRLVMATDRPDEAFQVTILNSPVVNAFALPNGRLYVTRGLLALANDTSEVAAVLSHEIAHVTLRHASQRSELQARSDLIERVAENVLNDAEEAAMAQNQARSALASFSRAQELEADQTGVKVLARAGFDWLIVDVVCHESRIWTPVNLQICDPTRPTTLVSGGPGRRPRPRRS